MRPSLILIALAALSSAPGPAAATPEHEPWLAVIGRPITAIEVDAPPGEDAEQLLRLSGLAVGEPYRVAQVRRAIELLFSIGRFETVRVHARPDVGGGPGVALRIELPPEPRLVEVRVLDSELLDEADVRRISRLELGATVSATDLSRMGRALEAHLEDLGHRDPAVGLALESVDDAGGRALVVRVNEGPVTRLRKVVVRGRPRLPLWQLGRQVGIRPGDVLDLERVREALESLRARYRRLGYLDAEIDEPAVRELPGGGLADLVVDVRAGPKVRVRIEGNRAVPTRDLEADTAPLFELGTGPSSLTEVTERMLDRYSKRGFWKAKVEVATRTTPDKAKREVLFSIREGPRARVKSLTFPGNRALDPSDLRDRVFETVARALASDFRRPGADPEVVGLALGDRSVDTPRDSPQPDNTAPDPKKVYLPRAYRAATDALEDMYRAEGYQTADVLEPEVRPVEGGQLEVEIPVKEGVQWRIGALSFAGNEAVPAAKLFSLSGLDTMSKDGAPLAFTKVEEARRAIFDHYRNAGYLYVQLFEELRQVPPRGSLGWDFVQSSTVAPFDVQSVCARAAAAGKDHCDVELRFRIDEGARVEAGEVIVRGVEKTRRGVIEDEVRVRTGEVLSEADLVATRDNLLRIGVFERVKVRPVDEDRRDSVKDVLVEVKERRPYSFELGGGFSTAEGVRAVVGFGDRNLFGTALRLQLQAKLNLFLTPQLVLYSESVRDAVRASYTCDQFDRDRFAADGTIECVDEYSVFERLEYEVAMGLSYPRIFGLPDGFSAGLDMIVLRDYDAAYAEDAQRVTLLGNYKGYRPKLLGKERPLAVQVRTSFERSDLRCNQTLGGDRAGVCSTQLDPNNPDPARLEGTNFYAGLGPQVSFDLRDDPFDPRAGVYMELSADAAVGLDAGSPNIFTVEGRINGYIPLASRLTLALAAIFGRVFPLEQIVPNEVEIPINRRFFAGGRSTVRGYAERTLIPQDAPLGPDGVAAATISTGGRSLLALKSELRIALYGPVSLAVFYDIGDLWEGGFAFETTQTVGGETFTRTLAHGGGVGLRVATPIGPLALDFAVPFNKRDPIVNDTQLHFSVGAF